MLSATAFNLDLSNTLSFGKDVTFTREGQAGSLRKHPGKKKTNFTGTSSFSPDVLKPLTLFFTIPTLTRCRWFQLVYNYVIWLTKHVCLPVKTQWEEKMLVT